MTWAKNSYAHYKLDDKQRNQHHQYCIATAHRMPKWFLDWFTLNCIPVGTAHRFNCQISTASCDIFTEYGANGNNLVNVWSFFPLFFQFLLKQLLASCTAYAAKEARGKQSRFPSKGVGRLTCWVAVQTAPHPLSSTCLSPRGRRGAPWTPFIERKAPLLKQSPPDCYSAAIWHNSVCVLSQNKRHRAVTKGWEYFLRSFFVQILQIFNTTTAQILWI